jgi:hypothetical protein
VFPAGGAATIQLVNDTAHRTLELKSNVKIVGPGAKALAVKGGGPTSDFSVFTVDSGVTAAISGLTVTGAHVSYAGGGIVTVGNLTLTDCAITGNSAPFGGGIATDGVASLFDCTLSGNSGSLQGGAIWAYGSSLTLTNCTVAGNTAIYGGGITHSGGLLTLTNCTVAANRGVNVSYGAIYSQKSTVILSNTIVAGNTAESGAAIKPLDIVLDAPTVNASGSYNLIGTGGSGGLKDQSVDPAHHNRVGVTNPGLGPLQDNGGPTPTMALLLGSPAHNAGSNALVPPGITHDQRGFPRFSGGVTDIGAYESQDIPALLAPNPLIPGANALVIVGSPKNNLIVIDAGLPKIGALSIMRKPTQLSISVTINGVGEGTFSPTSRDIFIAAGRGSNRVVVKGAQAGSLKLHAIDGDLRVTTITRSGSVTHILRAGKSKTPLVFG